MTAADWLKFLPGWLAFTWTVSLGARKVWVRRHHLALGLGADDLRTQLTTARSLFHEVTFTAPGFDWFVDRERVHVADKLRDAANRTKDQQLREHVQSVAGAWSLVGALAVPSRPGARWLDGDGTPTARTQEEAQRDLAEIKRTQEMISIANESQSKVKAALDRLNELERETIGRS